MPKKLRDLQPWWKSLSAALFCISLLVAHPAFGESASPEYPGVKDPFGDPTNNEFDDDEQNDKEFFHLGRMLMIGLDLGAGFFTGGLGLTTAPGINVGGRFVFFFDRSIAMEVAAHYSNHLDTMRNSGGATSYAFNVDFVPITLGIRYYFDTRGAPRALAIANPYLAFGGGIYLRNLTVLNSSGGIGTVVPGSTTNFGGYAGFGTEFLIYKSHVYLGLDLRYNLVAFSDSGTAVTGGAAGSRGGDYISTLATLTFNF